MIIEATPTNTATAIFVNVIVKSKGYTFDDMCATFDVAEDFDGDVDAAFAAATECYEDTVKMLAYDPDLAVKFIVVS